MIPDWRDPNAYPKPNSLTPSQWAWEFLRRNDDYRKDWQEFARCIGDLIGGYPDYKWSKSASFDAEKLFAVLHFRIDPATGEHVHSMHNNATSRTLHLSTYLGMLKWGLRDMFDPDGPIPHRPWLEYRGKVRQPETPGTFVPDAPHLLMIRVNLLLPLADQYSQIKDLCQEVRKDRQRILDVVNPKPRLYMFPGYLRVLDADFEKVSQREMANVIIPDAPDAKTIENWLSAAKDYVRRDYLYLPLAKDSKPDITATLNKDGV